MSRHFYVASWDYGVGTYISNSDGTTEPACTIEVCNSRTRAYDVVSTLDGINNYHLSVVSSAFAKKAMIHHIIREGWVDPTYDSPWYWPMDAIIEEYNKSFGYHI